MSKESILESAAEMSQDIITDEEIIPEKRKVTIDTKFIVPCPLCSELIHYKKTVNLVNDEEVSSEIRRDRHVNNDIHSIKNCKQKYAESIDDSSGFTSRTETCSTCNYCKENNKEDNTFICTNDKRSPEIPVYAYEFFEMNIPENPERIYPDTHLWASCSLHEFID